MNSSEQQIINLLIIDKDREPVTKLTGMLAGDPRFKISHLSKFPKSSDELDKTGADMIFLDSRMNDVFLDTKPDIYSALISGNHNRALVLLYNNQEDILPLFRIDLHAALHRDLPAPEVHRVIREYLLEQKINQVNARARRSAMDPSEKKLRFSTRKGHVFLKMPEIIYCEADSNYTHLILTNNRQITVSKSLHHFDNNNLSPLFYRISRSAIINTEYLVEINRADRTCVLKENGTEVTMPVTRKYLRKLLDDFSS